MTPASAQNRIAPVVAGLITLAVVAHSFYISGTLYSYYLVGLDVANFFIRTTMDMVSARSVHDFIVAMFPTHGQHILLGMQIANILVYWSAGHLDFQALNLLGTVYLCVPALLMIHQLRVGARGLLLVSAILFPLLLSPGHYSCAINPACSANHYLGLSLAIIALFFFAQTPLSLRKTLLLLLLGEFFSFLAIFSSPAALALIPASTLAIYYGFQKRTMSLTLHAVFCVLILATYFSIARSPDDMFQDVSSIFDWLKIIALAILFFFNLLGSFLPLPESPPLWGAVCSILAGMLVTGYGLFQGYRTLPLLRERADLRLFVCGFLLMLGMIFLISAGRFFTFGSSRYIFYACFALGFLLLQQIALRRPRRSRLSAAAVVAMLYYLLEVALHQHSFDYFAETMADCERRWMDGQLACGVMIKHQEITDLLLEAQSRGILQLQPRKSL